MLRLIMTVISLALMLGACGGDDSVVATPEQIESIAEATLGEQLINVGNYEFRESGYFFTVEFEETNVPEDIQATTKTLAEAFMLQGVETIGLTVRTPEANLAFRVSGATGAILNLDNTY